MSTSYKAKDVKSSEDMQMCPFW